MFSFLDLHRQIQEVYIFYKILFHFFHSPSIPSVHISTFCFQKQRFIPKLFLSLLQTLILKVFTELSFINNSFKLVNLSPLLIIEKCVIFAKFSVRGHCVLVGSFHISTKHKLENWSHMGLNKGYTVLNWVLLLNKVAFTIYTFL